METSARFCSQNAFASLSSTTSLRGLALGLCNWHWRGAEAVPRTGVDEDFGGRLMVGV